jgi:ribulose-phosphate 3-epimerase
MVEIIPAIMPDSFNDLVAKATRVKGVLPLAQIDIMDGVFVGSKSWPYRNAGEANDLHFLAMQNQEETLPFFDELDYEIDLMITEPEKHIEEWLPLGASRLIFHIESIKNYELFFGHDFFIEGARQIGGQTVIEVGIAIDPGTSLEKIETYIAKVDFVQCMGIAKIGYQGEPFDERVLDHINALRIKYPNLPISVDGGVTTESAPLLRAAGANRLVSGSAIFNSGDIATTAGLLKGV